MLEGELTEIQASFGRICIVIEHRYKDNILYYELEGYVSRAGLSFIFEEAKCSKKTGMDKEKCGCVI